MYPFTRIPSSLDAGRSRGPVEWSRSLASPIPGSPPTAICLPLLTVPWVFLSSLVVLACGGPWATSLYAESPPPSGIRQVVGRHLTLMTDLPADSDIDQLPRVFDAAVEQWCEYFRVPRERAQSWKMVGYLIQDRDRFLAAGLIPNDLPRFLNGYQRGDRFWFHEQPSAFYRRHLMLHEGTHGFMNKFLGGCGPPWYMEGMAEYLATHEWDGGTLTMATMPRHKDNVPHWGRIRIIREEFAAGRGLSFVEIMRFSPTAHLRVEPYAWCWAIALFLDRHPDYQKAFREIRLKAADDSLEFSRTFLRRLGKPLPEIELRWQDFIRQLDYGYDVPRALLRFATTRSLDPRGTELTMQADQGWQSSGITVDPGRTYELTASGRFQVHDVPRPWLSEPQGVTLRYIEGKPLGALLAAVVPVSDIAGAAMALQNPQLVGKQAELTVTKPGTLFFKINDSPAELAGNRGEINVRVVPRP
jgi:hypothetical protein